MNLRLLLRPSHDSAPHIGTAVWPPHIVVLQLLAHSSAKHAEPQRRGLSQAGAVAVGQLQGVGPHDALSPLQAGRILSLQGVEVKVAMMPAQGALDTGPLRVGTEAAADVIFRLPQPRTQPCVCQPGCCSSGITPLDPRLAPKPCAPQASRP